MNTYCGGDKSAMRTMIACIERGEERDVELLARFGRMKAYLEKRDEQAGEWVYQVCPRRSAVGAEALLSHPFPGSIWYNNVRLELMDSWQKWSNQVDLMKCDSNPSTTMINPITTPTPDPILRESKKTQ
jgi:hypothetical protein